MSASTENPTSAQTDTVFAVTWKTPGEAGRRLSHVQETLDAFERRRSDARASGWTALRSWYRVQPDGNVVPDFLPFDFDDKDDIRRAFADALRLITILAMFGVAALSVQIFFSGSKGVLVAVPAAIFNPQPATLETWKARAKTILTSWKNRFGLTTLDVVPIGNVGLFRVGNTKHLDGDAWRIPLLWQDLRRDPEAVRKFARLGPRDLELDALDATPVFCQELAADWENCAGAVDLRQRRGKRGPHGETELPEVLPDRSKKLIDALPWPHQLLYTRASAGKTARPLAILILSKCPACESDERARRGAEREKAWITPVTLTFKCYRAKCPANTEPGDGFGGLPPEVWIPRFAPQLLPLLTVSHVKAPPSAGDRVPVAELEPRVRATLDAAELWATEKAGRIGVANIRPPGAGKSRAQLKKFMVSRGRGTMLTPSHALADEREAEYQGQVPDSGATKSASLRTRRYKGALRRCIQPDPVKLRLQALSQSGWGLRNTACPRCPKRDECTVPNGFRGTGLRVGTHAHAAGLERLGELRDPLVLDEAPPLVNTVIIECGDLLQRITRVGLPPAIEAWTEARRDVSEVLLVAAPLLQKLHEERVNEGLNSFPRKKVFSTRASGELLRTLATEAAARLIARRQGFDERQLDVRGNSLIEELGAPFLQKAIAVLRSATGRPVPEPPILNMEALAHHDLPHDVRSWPRPDTDRLLLALADEMDGTLPSGVTACLVADDEGKHARPVRIEVRQRMGLVWDEGERGRVTRLGKRVARARTKEAGRRLQYRDAMSSGQDQFPDQGESSVLVESVRSARRQLAKELLDLRRMHRDPKRSRIVLDATGHWTEEGMRRAFPNREVRLFSLEAFRPGVEIRRVFLQTDGAFRLKLLSDAGRGDRMSRDAGTLIARLIKRSVQAGRVTTCKAAVEVGVITYKKVAEIIRIAWVAARDADATERHRATQLLEKRQGRAILDALLEIGSRISSLQVGHFGGERGSNKFLKCDSLLLIGTPFPNIDAAGEDARTLRMNPDLLVDSVVEAELEQAVGRIRILWVDGPRVILHAAKEQAAAWRDCEVFVDPVLAGGPLPAQAADDLELALALQAEAMGIACVDLLNFMSQDLSRLDFAKGRNNSLLKELVLIRSWCGLSQSAMLQVLTRAYGECRKFTVPRNGGPGCWTAREVRPGAEADLRRMVETWRAAAAAGDTGKSAADRSQTRSESPTVLPRPELVATWNRVFNRYRIDGCHLPFTAGEAESILERAGVLIANGEDPEVADLVARSIQVGAPAAVALGLCREIVRAFPPAQPAPAGTTTTNRLIPHESATPPGESAQPVGDERGPR